MIKPLPGIVYIKVEEAKAGDLITSSKLSAVEFAEVLAVGEGINNTGDPSRFSLKVGDKIFVKAWGIDIVNHEEQTYHFVNIENKSILAVIE